MIEGTDDPAGRRENSGTGRRAAVVDDSPYLITTLGVWLGPAWELQGYHCIEDLLSDTTLDVDLILLDLGLNDVRADERAALLTGIRGVRKVVALGPPVLVVTGEARPHVLAAAVAAGAHGVLHKNESPDLQVEAIRAVAAGGSVLSPAVAQTVRQVLARQPAALTDRQRDVLVMRVQGRTWKQIARQLQITEDTAHDHQDAVVRKFREFLTHRSKAELVTELGVAPGDIAC